MKFRNLFFAFVFCALQLAVKAQIVNNLVVFSNEGQPFTLILDGLKENQTPATNVRVVGLDLKAYQVKVIYEDKKLKDANTTITFFRTGKECVFGLNKKGKKKHTIVYVSEKEIDGFLTNANQPISTNPAPTDIQNLTSVPTTVPTPEPVPTPTLSVYQTLLNSIAAQPTEAGKLTTALTLLKNGTLSIAQIKQVLAFFATDQSKLAFAKQACAQLKDPTIYAQIVGAFISEPIKQELQIFLQGKK
ncbi:MAG TPA: DUF4476 domain-containing protein [Bacteroidia bacterium]|jgi:hypothetical protein|nr:DUF4476 domain-containing protein [Bacteroidia bacterium]